MKEMEYVYWGLLILFVVIVGGAMIRNEIADRKQRANSEAKS